MKRKALVVVLGALARSPRMQYHCMSLANNNYDVTVIANNGGPSGDKACEDVETNGSIKQNLMPDTPDFRKYLPSFLAYIIKPIWQSFVIFYHLCIICKPNVIIVQNPPSIPTLSILYLYSKFTGSKFIIDWHNYGFSILNLNVKLPRLLIRAYQANEIFFGRMADAGFCVSEAMRKDLIDNFQITYPLYVLYDKPPRHFKPLTLRERHNFYLKMMEHQIPEFKFQTSPPITDQNQYSCPSPPSNATPCKQHHSCCTRFTTAHVINKNKVISRPNRPAIIMSSTSWTEDEDFDLLLDALKRYDLTRTNQEATRDLGTETNYPTLPNLVCVITGKGPLKAYFKDEIRKCNFKHIEMILPWLSATDYAKMVASCDLGISLHSSSSGVDLPMKVVDMFGCGIPVLAYNYEAIGELVIEDFYGLTFRNSEDLFTKLALLLKDFYKEDNCSRDDVECSPLGRYKKNLKRRFLLSRWEDNWNSKAKPVFD